MALNIKKMYLC